MVAEVALKREAEEMEKGLRWGVEGRGKARVDGRRDLERMLVAVVDDGSSVGIDLGIDIDVDIVEREAAEGRKRREATVGGFGGGWRGYIGMERLR
jgi:hypothetical protein